MNLSKCSFVAQVLSSQLEFRLQHSFPNITATELRMVMVLVDVSDIFHFFCSGEGKGSPRRHEGAVASENPLSRGGDLPRGGGGGAGKASAGNRRGGGGS